MFLSHFHGRRVFVTGHTGFKGFWLTTWLLKLGANVAGYSLDYPTSPSGFRALGLERQITHILGDVRDRSRLVDAVTAFKPDIIFHMAAQSLVRSSYHNPALTFETNAIGVMNILEAARNLPKLQAMVLITSDKCYQNREWVYGYRETDALGGNDPYSASKACAEIITQAYSSSFFVKGARVATVRAGNVIGGGDWAEDRIVPDCARAWGQGTPVVIRSPYATRPWQHVLEPLSGYLWLGANLMEEFALAETDEAQPAGGLHGEAFNFGPLSEVNATVGQLAEELSRHWPGFSVSMDRSNGDAKKECTLLKLCCDKALARLAWKATLRFTDTVRMTAEWYKSWNDTRGREAETMYAVTDEQIDVYASMAREQGASWAL